MLKTIESVYVAELPKGQPKAIIKRSMMICVVRYLIALVIVLLNNNVYGVNSIPIRPATVYSGVKSPSVGEVRSATSDDSERIWIGGENSLQFYDGDHFYEIPGKENLPKITAGFANVAWMKFKGGYLYFTWADLLIDLI